MNRTFKAAVAALIFAVGFAGLVVAGPFEDAVAAYNKGDYATALRLLRPLESLRGDPSTFVVIIVAVAFLAGRFSKRSPRRTSLGSRAELARQAWWKRRWRRDQAWTSEGVVPFNPGVSPVTDPAEQLRFVMAARFEKRRLLSRSEAHVLYAAERAINTADLKWRVMAQVSLGEVLSSPDARAYSAINSKRVDLLIVSRFGDPIAAIEYQGHGHYQGTAAARDAVKKEALRKAGVRYIEVTPENGPEDMTREISRIARSLDAALPAQITEPLAAHKW